MIKRTFLALALSSLSVSPLFAQNVYPQNPPEAPGVVKIYAPAVGCADDGCATTPMAHIPGCETVGCAEAGCGAVEGCVEEEDCLTHSLDAIFGDKPLLGCLRDQEMGPFKYSVGGALRHRYMNEKNRIRPGGAGQTDYHLWRFTPFIDMSYGDNISGRVEGIDASAFGYDAPFGPVGIDVNRMDLLQAYVDIKLADFEGGGTLKYRYGRQFLKYGSQHLLSPLAWANTFRNFEGHKLMYTSKDWNIDGFHMNSVNGAAGGAGFSDSSFDEADSDRTISGIYSTYKGMKNNTLDLYWLHFEDETSSNVRQDGKRDTFGARLAGTQAVKEGKKTVGTWNWDLEGALQTGTDQFITGMDQDVSAGFFSATGGYQFATMPWKPKVNGIFYYGSGDSDATDGEINTFHSIYPLAHAYWGLIDNFSGQNLVDVGASITAKPHEKLTLLAAVHKFKLAEQNDALYNIVGAPFALGSDDIGTEIDLVGTLAVTKNINVQLGYFWFLYGEGVDNSGLSRGDASQFYAQTTLKF